MWRYRPEPSVEPAATTAAGSTDDGPPFELPPRPLPGMLLAWKPAEVAAAERARVEHTLVVGRSPAAAWTITDRRLSKEHFALRLEAGRVLLSDRGSTNGSFVNGRRVEAPTHLQDQDVVRAGRCVFVFQADLRPIVGAPEVDLGAYGLAGPFHSPALLGTVDEAVRTGRHLLLEGESGVGKKRIARAIHRYFGTDAPFVAHNCARFTSAEETDTTLFGVVRGVFTGVEARPGLVERAEGGILYLDELHQASPRLQRSLLRLADGGEFNRVGDAAVRYASLRLLLGTNRPVETAIREGTLAHDLVARTHRLAVPPLNRRRADVPAIFLALMPPAGGPGAGSEDPPADPLSADAAEALAVHDYTDANVRFLEDLAARCAARWIGVPPDLRRRKLAELFAERLPDALPLRRRAEPSAGPEIDGGRRPSRYETHRAAILDAYRACGGNLTAVEKTLLERQIVVHRRWLVEFLDRWGVRRRRSRAE